MPTTSSDAKTSRFPLGTTCCKVIRFSLPSIAEAGGHRPPDIDTCRTRPKQDRLEISLGWHHSQLSCVFLAAAPSPPSGRNTSGNYCRKRPAPEPCTRPLPSKFLSRRGHFLDVEPAAASQHRREAAASPYWPTGRPCNQPRTRLHPPQYTQDRKAGFHFRTQSTQIEDTHRQMTSAHPESADRSRQRATSTGMIHAAPHSILLAQDRAEHLRKSTKPLYQGHS